MAQPWNTLATHSGIDGAAHKSKGDGCHALGGCQIQKVGAIYTRTLEEGGAIYFENGVYGFIYCIYIYIWFLPCF